MVDPREYEVVREKVDFLIHHAKVEDSMAQSASRSQYIPLRSKAFRYRKQARRILSDAVSGTATMREHVADHLEWEHSIDPDSAEDWSKQLEDDGRLKRFSIPSDVDSILRDGIEDYHNDATTRKWPGAHSQYRGGLD